MESYPPTPAVLLVDDEESLLRSIRLALRSAGIHPVYIEPDARRVIRRLRRQTVGLILLDVAMPHISGERLLRRIHRVFPTISVVMLSASDDPDTVARCYQQGAKDYLVKPVARHRLVTTVRDNLRPSATIN